MKVYVYTSPGGASDSDWWHGLTPMAAPPASDANTVFDYVLDHAERLFDDNDEVHRDAPQWYALPNLGEPEPLYMRVHFHKGRATVLSQLELDPDHPCRLELEINRDISVPFVRQTPRQ